jgi:hypothetical protein
MPLSTKFELAVTANSGGTCPKCGRGVPAGSMMAARGICYECCLVADGKPPVEDHHVFGRPGPTVLIPGNFHRALNRQLEARRPILKRKTNDPSITAAQLFTVIAELAEAGADYARSLGLPDWVAELAKTVAVACRNMADEQLSIHAHVADQLGPDWHTKVALS